MFRKLFLSAIHLLFLSVVLSGQAGAISGKVLIDDHPEAFVQISVDSTTYGGYTNHLGNYAIGNIPYGRWKITASYIGHETITKEVIIDAGNEEVDLDFSIVETAMSLENIVITGTKTFKRQTNSSLIVNVVNSETLDNIQACNLSEGLKFQPGLRVETDCQTCNYTQLRMNGLAGGYSQILINGRPIFSPLTGLYGLEQIPANMIDRIEVVRGGGSSLYGSSAIGGTVNVLTKIPKDNSYALDYSLSEIEGQTMDHIINGNSTFVSETGKSGVSLLFSHRERGLYDNNGDNFSEIPEINNTSLATNLFFLPAENQKIELSLSNIQEYRYGGEMLDKPAFLTQQSEERNHNVWMANADYQINLNNENTSLITYVAWQHTDRDHYTGIAPDQDTPEYQEFLNNTPYGTSAVTTLNVGVQLNHRLSNFITGTNVITVGLEQIYDSVIDEIPAYHYLVDQQTKNTGLFVQSDWELLSGLTLLSGVRFDEHNLMKNIILNPRLSLLYKYKNNTQFRFSYGTGFRAPQVLDTDLHIAFAGGGVSRVSLDSELTAETSRSISASVNYDKPMENYIVGFTLETFHNRLNDAFILQPKGEDEFGENFLKQNGDGATVNGITLELRGNYDKKIQLETGFTLQRAEYDNPVQYIDELEGIREFIRTPNNYGFALLYFTPLPSWTSTLNYIYTGTMKVPHFAGAPNQSVDEIINSPAFSELSIKTAYNFSTPSLGVNWEVYTGIKNLFNAYQDDFDIGKNRDSNFVYGPAQPRTFYIGVKLSSK